MDGAVMIRKPRCCRPRLARTPGLEPAFTLIELLVVVSIITLLISILLPGLQRAKEQTRSAVCASNVRQLVIANAAYASDYSGRYCPGSPRFVTENLRRWHGTRNDTGEAFEPRNGPLVPYLGAGAGIRACPSFRDVQRGAGAFEAGCGGYGYNQSYIGQVVQRRANGSFQVVTDESGVFGERVRRPGETVMFGDTAFAGVAVGLIEYSFAEPRFSPEYLHYNARRDPSLHFRHGRRARIAWSDGHVSAERRTFTWKSVLYEGDPDRSGLGWFGPDDDNGLFDLE